MKSRILWIEDGAFSEMKWLTAPVYFSGLYELVIASTASEGYDYLMRKEFHAVIVDIRLPPGNDPFFIKAFSHQQSKVAARLGLVLLNRVLKPSGQQAVPGWISPQRFGVFTVESQEELSPYLEELGIEVFRQKTETLPKTEILHIVEEILGRLNRKET